MKFSAVLFLFVASLTPAQAAEGHDDEEHHECACEAEEYGFSIDCTAKTAMLDSLALLKSSGCATNCTSEVCKKNWFIVQSHHDYCDPNILPEEIEDDFHDFDETCESCEITRAFIEGAPDCPEPNCEDDSGNQAYVYLVENDCSTNCSSKPMCRDRFLTLQTDHDLCDHGVLSTTSEEGLHDFEDFCHGVVCNLPGSQDDQLTCTAKTTTSGTTRPNTYFTTTATAAAAALLTVGAALF